MNYWMRILFVCAIIVLMVVWLFPSRPAPVVRQWETPTALQSQPAYEERMQRSFDATVEILTDFLSHGNNPSSCEVLRRLADSDEGCLAIVGRIERKLTNFQNGRNESYRVQAKRLEGIGSELDQLAAVLPKGENEAEEEVNELSIMTDALYAQLEQFCKNLSGYDLQWRNPHIEQVY